MQLLVTGATGKVGQAFLARFLRDPDWVGARVIALCHNRVLAEIPRLRVVRGSINDPAVLTEALAGTTHVIHMATVKEDPVHAMDVSVKGMFLLLEEFRRSKTAQQFILIGGDCVVGHCFMPYGKPITEDMPRRPYPGVYALSKVLEEAMLEAAQEQYGVNGTILRAPWIMEKDDFRYALSFGPDQFGGPAWEDYITPQQRAAYNADDRVPRLLAVDGRPLKRNFVDVWDLVDAMMRALDNPAARQQTFNIAMTEPVDYGVVADYLAETRGMRPVDIPSPLVSNLLDNAKARLLLGWRPRIDTKRLIEQAWNYERAKDDPRKVWYVG